MDFESYLEFVMSRRSIRKYTSEKISHIQIERMIEAACWAPSSHNRQGWKFIVFEDHHQIQELAEEYGVEKPRFALGDHDCILCGLCVRACQEIIGKSAISLVNRGIYKEVAAPFYAYELGEGCIGCGDCAYVCPTGAIKMGENGKPELPRVRIPYAEIGAMASATEE